MRSGCRAALQGCAEIATLPTGTRLPGAAQRQDALPAAAMRQKRWRAGAVAGKFSGTCRRHHCCTRTWCSAYLPTFCLPSNMEGWALASSANSCITSGSKGKGGRQALPGQRHSSSGATAVHGRPSVCHCLLCGWEAFRRLPGECCLFSSHVGMVYQPLCLCYSSLSLPLCYERLCLSTRLFLCLFAIYCILLCIYHPIIYLP